MTTVSTVEKPLLRILACGSAGAGTSTLSARLFSDRPALPEGERNKRAGEIGANIAVQYITTPTRKFSLVDRSGDDAGFRELVEGATEADLAILVVDAEEGVRPQTRRCGYLVSLLGIRSVVLAVNKLDMVEYSEDVFDKICREFSGFAANLKFDAIVSIPLSVRHGDNLVSKSQNTPWYVGPPLLDLLEAINCDSDLESKPFRMPVDAVKATKSNSQEVSGTIVGGKIGEGDSVALAHSGRVSRVRRIKEQPGNVWAQGAGRSVSIVLDEQVDVAPGDVFVDPKARPEFADQFAANLLWLAEDEFLPHRQYLIKIGAQTVPAHVSQLKHKIDMQSLEHLAARTLHLGEIGYCNFSTASAIAFDRYSQNRAMGRFVVIDEVTQKTVGLGLIEFGLRRATNVHWQALDVNAQARAGLKNQKPCILWFTGLSGSGKSTIANLVEKRLFAEGRHTYILDGDNVRHGLSQDLGFTDADRVENIRRVAEAANLFTDAGLIVLASFISPFRSERRLARELAKEGQFIEIFVDTPLGVCISRDPKGLYRRAQAGEIKNFTGIDSPYEVPEKADLVLKTENVSAEEMAERVVAYLSEKGLVP